MNLSAANARPELRTPRRPCTGTLRTRGHGMWGGEAPARPSAAARLRRSCTETMRTRGHGMWGGEAPARPAAAARLRRSCTETMRTRGRGCGVKKRRPVPQPPHAAAIVHRNDANARAWARAAANAAMAVRPGGSGRPPAAAARPLPRPHGASLKVPRQRAKTARGRRIRRSRACHSHCLRAVCVSPASRAPGAPCSRSPHRRSRRARRSRPAPATARWYGNGS